MEEDENQNIIPPITDPLGKHWRQPNPENFAIDCTHALMTEADFQMLPEYSTTVPSAVYSGKCWKSERRGVWYLRWYGKDDGDPRGLPTPWREILIV